MVLSQFENIIDDDNLSFRKNCGKLVAGIVSEYALSCLKIKEKDVISIRGKGKFIIDEIIGNTKKGNFIINVKKYV